MEGDLTNIYGDTGGSLVGALIGYLVGLFVVVGGFILASRYLIGKRVEWFERDWRASHGTIEGGHESKNRSDDEMPPPDR
jgi:uncharacterized protein YqgC (DUF456 family)